MLEESNNEAAGAAVKVQQAASAGGAVILTEKGEHLAGCLAVCVLHISSLTSMRQAYCRVHPAGEDSEGASSDGAGGDALGLGYDSEGDDEVEESHSAPVGQDNEVGVRKKEETVVKVEAAPLQEEALTAETGEAVAVDAPAEAAAPDAPEIPASHDSQLSVPSTMPTQVHKAAAKPEDATMDQPPEATSTPASADVQGASAPTSEANGQVGPSVTPGTDSSPGGGACILPAFSKGDKYVSFPVICLHFVFLVMT